VTKFIVTEKSNHNFVQVTSYFPTKPLLAANARIQNGRKATSISITFEDECNVRLAKL